MAAHLAPLGPKPLHLNDTAGAAGMALFFTLSGFLIVSFLANGMALGDFLTRRIARIVPLAWVAITILVLWQQPDFGSALRNYLFVANLPPATLMEGGHHLWSLGVEMQFYALAALLVWMLGRRGLYLVPVLCLAVTVARIYDAQYISIVTWHRLDEILAGGTLALIHHRLGKIPLVPAIIAFVVCSHPATGALQYLRPYAASLMVAASFARPPRVLLSKPMTYIAEISYALYVIHGVLMATWLGAGSKLVIYLKRPLLIGCTFLFAHASTRYFEHPIMRAAKRFNYASYGRTSRCSKMPESLPTRYRSR